MREMKDSGLPWTGLIPQKWDVIRGKYYLKYMQKPVKDDDGVITCFRDGEVTLRSNRREEGFTISDKEIGYQGIDIGDLVIHGMDGFAGAIGISDSRGKASPVLNVLDTLGNKKYIMYFLRNMAFNDVFLALATGIRVRSCDLRWNKLSELSYLVPPKDEQDKIANFLDRKCSEIDALVTDIHSEIYTLEAYKQSVITEAVTKGLDKNVPMKKISNIWVKDIPEKWNFLKAGYLFVERSIRADGSETPLSLSQKDGLVKSDDMVEYAMKSKSYDGWKKVWPNDLVLNRFKAHLGVFFCSKYSGMVSFHYGVFIPKTKLNVKFYEYLFHSAPYRDMFAELSNGMTVGLQNLGNSAFYAAKCIFPPVEEQNKIVDYLDNFCSEIGFAIQEKQEQLEVLADYKKSLIYEYVTGKKEVPEVE
ncbi:restriction endonuclease subunit S [uncultured Anaerovibrio sp.]|uniref:restriction endonuclease subunit S n=1 Tax=uncultured Anaerovibrio sp. TaxID=361586 RepID=UPI0026294BD0|nr:restriction endonuclease subunit S [uncultured Anaerovibrio sp.]